MCVAGGPAAKPRSVLGKDPIGERGGEETTMAAEAEAEDTYTFTDEAKVSVHACSS